MNKYQLPQVNIGRIKAPLDDPQMAGFMGRLDEINRLADDSPGFVWRLQTDAGNATYFRPYGDERLLMNMSVWESVESLRNYVYKTAHAELLRQRQAWFEKLTSVYLTLWWVPRGHVPSIDEAKERLAYLEEHGPTEFAFNFRTVFEAADQLPESHAGSQFSRTAFRPPQLLR